MRKVVGAREWVGGRVTAPFYVTEPEPYRPEMILWLELPEDLIVASTLLDPEGPPVSFGDTLLDVVVMVNLEIAIKFVRGYGLLHFFVCELPAKIHMPKGLD